MSSMDGVRKVSELSRQFDRSETSLNSSNSSPPANRGRILPKVLGHIPKQSPEPVRSQIASVKNNGLATDPSSTSQSAEEDDVSFKSLDGGHPAAKTEVSGPVGSEPEEEETAKNVTVTVTSVVETPQQPVRPPLRPSRHPSFNLHPVTNASERLIGLDCLQEQVQRLALRRGFTLNILVVGRSGLGKSTLINTLFRSSVLPRVQHQATEARPPPPVKTTAIRTTQTVVQENGVKLELTVTDTPGFGDRIDNTNCWDPVLHYINEQYEKYLEEEQSAHRMRWIRDTRVHCCLYFLPPAGNGLRPLDLEVLKRLHNVVNVIPVIAKSDTLTIEEREEFKTNIRRDLAQHRIETYPLQKYEHIEDFELNQSYRDLMPFAVVGGEDVHQFKGRPVLGRHNGWGFVQIEEPSHCEFYHLKNLLIRNRMQDLIELTSAIHYEAFRRRRLIETNGNMIDIASLNESHI